MTVKNPFTIKQWAYIAHIERYIGKDVVKQCLLKSHGNKHLMQLSPDELNRFIKKMFLKYSIPKMHWVTEDSIK